MTAAKLTKAPVAGVFPSRGTFVERSMPENIVLADPGASRHEKNLRTRVVNKIMDYDGKAPEGVQGKTVVDCHTFARLLHEQLDGHYKNVRSAENSDPRLKELGPMRQRCKFIAKLAVIERRDLQKIGKYMDELLNIAERTEVLMGALQAA